MLCQRGAARLRHVRRGDHRGGSTSLVCCSSRYQNRKHFYAPVDTLYRYRALPLYNRFLSSDARFVALPLYNRFFTEPFPSIIDFLTIPSPLQGGGLRIMNLFFKNIFFLVCCSSRYPNRKHFLCTSRYL